jgi:hypothetical protein
MQFLDAAAVVCKSEHPDSKTWDRASLRKKVLKKDFRSKVLKKDREKQSKEK